MHIVNYDTVIVASYNYPIFIDFDLDENGAKDMRLISKMYGSLGSGTYLSAEVSCLENYASLVGVIGTDTTFSHLDTAYSGNLGAYSVYYLRYFTCYREGANDLILSIRPNNFTVTNFGTNSIVKQTDLVKTGTYILDQSRWGSDVPVKIGQSADTTFYTQTFDFRYNCDNIPNAQVRYLSFKMNFYNRLGWIKFALVDHNKIHLLQTAIQE